MQRVFAAGIERDDLAIAVLVARAALPGRSARSRRRAPSGTLRRTGPAVALTSSAVTSVIATTISASRPGHCRSSACSRREHRRHVEILPGRRQILDAVEHAMMVGQHQAVPADDAGRASRQPDRGEPDMIEPGRVREQSRRPAGLSRPENCRRSRAPLPRAAPKLPSKARTRAAANDSFSFIPSPGRQANSSGFDSLALRTSGKQSPPDQAAVGQPSSTSFTTVASCFSENGFGRKPNLASAGRFLANASSA